MGIENYRISPANNQNVLATGSVAENTAPSTLNDGVRQSLADTKNWYLDAEWIEIGNGETATTYTRVSGTTITIGANVISQYHVGRRVKIKDGTGTTIYGQITSSNYTSPNTTVVMNFDNSTSIGSGTITSVKLGIVSALNSSIAPTAPTGSIIMWSGATIIDNWLYADGTMVSKTTYSNLWNLLGSTYGTPSGSDFYLPNLKDKFVIGKGATYNTLGATGGASTVTPSGTNSAPTFTGTASTPTGTITVAGTTANHSLTESQMPSHQHFITNTGNGFPNQLISNPTFTMTSNSNGGAGNNDYTGFSINAVANAGKTNSVGSGTGHNHSLSATGSFTGVESTPEGTINTPTFTGASASIINPYIALSYIIKT